MEQVSEDKGKQYADEINAIFQITSARNGIGINELFYDIGCKILNPNYNKTFEIPTLEKKDTISLKKIDFIEEKEEVSDIKKSKKKKCCKN